MLRQIAVGGVIFALRVALSCLGDAGRRTVAPAAPGPYRRVAGARLRRDHEADCVAAVGETRREQNREPQR
jgi:hypothetical protein